MILEVYSSVKLFSPNFRDLVAAALDISKIIHP